MKIHTKALLIFATAMVILLSVVFLLSTEITVSAYRELEIARMKTRAERFAVMLQRSGPTADVQSELNGDSLEFLPATLQPVSRDVQIEITDPGEIVAVFPVPGSGAEPDRLAKLTHTRTELETGQRAIRVFLIAFAIAGGVLFLLVFFGLDRAVLSPIRALQRRVASAAATRGQSVALGSEGGNEVSLLAREIEQLTESLSASDEQAHQLSSRLLTMQDEERRRIARDLHDSTAQVLAAIQMNLSTLASIDVDANPQARRILQQTRDLANQCGTELRTISHLLHPPLLDEIGLVFAVRLFVDGFAKRSGIEVDFEAPDPLPRLAVDVETALFRIVQESLSNVHRHSGAKCASVLVERESDGLTVGISDDGIGLSNGQHDSDHSQAPLGVGLLGMRERIAQFRGTLRVTSDSTGTKVTAFVPWEWEKTK